MSFCGVKLVTHYDWTALLFQALGAEVQRQRPVSITHPDHFVNVAKRIAAATPNAVFADQFENLANMKAHNATGQEILDQTRGCLDAFVCGAGTSISSLDILTIQC